MAGTEITPFMSIRELKLKTPLGTVYEQVSFDVGKGQVCALYGGAGSGKTSLLLTACGRMKPSGGNATVAGYDMKSKYRPVRRSSSISFIPRLNDVQPFLKVSAITGAELSLVNKKGNKAAAYEYLKRWHFEDKEDVRFEDLDAYDTAYFGILLACACDPQLLCVDDVQSDMTQHQGIKLVELLKLIAEQTGVTVLFCCSEYEIARHADGIVVLSEDAEMQRQAVLRERGPAADVKVFGVGNGVVLGSSGATLDEGSSREPDLLDGDALGSSNAGLGDGGFGERELIGGGVQ